MSDSELSEASATPVPPDRELEKSLRREVVKAQKEGVEFSYNYIRAASEKSLGLTSGFYKNHPEWKQRSKQVVDSQLEADEEEEEDGDAQSPPSPQLARPKATAKKEKEPAARSKKRAPVQKEPAPRKRQKKTSEKDDDVSEDLSSPLSEPDLEPETATKDLKKQQRKVADKPHAPAKTQRPSSSSTKKAAAKKSKSDSDEESKEASSSDDDATPATGASATNDKDDGDDAGSESELSVLLDEEPQPKKKKGKQKESRPQTQGKSRKTAGNKTDTDADPDQAEIKRLQGWLLKCGIRKLWGKELKPYETPKAKIKHLKEMLADVGMTGRYSIEKANQIREARELAADIEAVQEGAERWGAEEGDEKQDGGRPGARRLVRGAKNYDFLSSDGEETD
ncbi:hypothetical protein HRR83_007120 [Exophiala dermatitidis]|uniref:Transcriptional regulator n=2 Tax=Exophiala dermatitidis TaxID=5970 RepID=H6C4M3_EXODN|nr:uncharacterized protein HMPREF1120_06515 [Exophiala dermatitidis NIH/UT8656]KAJ4509192.1 hypothetical protein HRR75_006163 [Exophiala dermatitidis]EHY58505.1 hypothetical protein HMPREF1120_06515 [Exophiala dermatitidis NIH/UT8656]KAJ4511081.1 hypothetical protein HRR73_006412 [Exophiala dermatitidis]KAJ4511984.1 hypothetical protein HRR74_006720 [Exophiala dermatitidis]KAJ4534848.1 hypothetical protein HRR76_006756 [Exophiala dermatitidis]